MAPKKPNTRELGNLAVEYGIHFEGPVPSSQWPRRYRHLFQVIRVISSNHYDDYEKRTDLNPKLKRKQIDRVRELRLSATALRKDFECNEEVWRDSIEVKVVWRFDQEIICNHCKNENFMSEYQAEPFESEDRIKLTAKRDLRRLCRCGDGAAPVRNFVEDSDEEMQTKIFSLPPGAKVNHDMRDKLENFRIPMKPDRVIGLEKTDRYEGRIRSFPSDITPCPTRRPQLLYPFLVIEAKREKDAPGFRSVEMQTAFPIRRFLKIQAELRLASQIEMDPLVWFFGFQGEEWRLYAAVLEDKLHDKVKIYHLWHGIIESQDSALQIFQIVDFIWTWARDVYRPQIRRCLSRHSSDQRAPSPTSTAPLQRAQSILSVHSIRTVAPLPPRPPLSGSQASERTSNADFSDARTHTFLRRADPHDLSRPFAQDCSIRHSDIVLFSFRNLDMPQDLDSLRTLIGTLRCGAEEQEMMMHALNFVRQDQISLTMRRDQIRQIEESWTGAISQRRSLSSNTSQMVKAFFFFRTFFQHKDWQLKRELYCVTFSAEAAALMTTVFGADIDCCFEDNLQTTDPHELVQELRNLRHLSGRQSVGNAIVESALYVSHCDNDGAGGIQVKWHPPDQRIPKTCIEKLADLFISVSGTRDTVCAYHRQSENLLFIHRTAEAAEATGVTSGLQEISDDVGRNEAMLIIRANSWPRECSRFCLFVLIDQNFDDAIQLGRFLDRAISTPEMYLTGEHAQQQPLSRREKDTLIKWKNSWRG